MARLLGFSDFAHLALAGMGGAFQTPQAVDDFLESIARQVLPKSREELALLIDIRQRLKFTTDAHAAHVEQAKVGQTVVDNDEVHMWDKAFLMGHLKASLFDLDSRQLSAYFSDENCMRGMAILCDRLFDLELVQVPVPPAEDWTAGHGARTGRTEIRKFELRERTGAVLGHIYLDLFRRANKFDGSSCFVIRCALYCAAIDN